MFGIDGGEFVVLALLALFLLGPERLPGLAKQAARALHDVRRWTQRTRADIGRELGPEFENFDLADLNPKRFVQKHLLDPLEDDDEDEDKPAKPAKQLEPASGPTYGHAALRSQTGTDGDGDAVSLLKSPADGGSGAAAVTIGPAFTTDLFAAPAGAALALAPAPARSTLTVPAWGDTASAREAGDSFDPDLDTGFDFDADSELADDETEYQSDLDTDEDDSTSWEHSLTAFYLPPPVDMDAT